MHASLQDFPCSAETHDLPVIPSMRNTKIVCTLGPACDSPEQVKALIEAGANIIRLNFSHGTHEWHERALRTVRAEAAKLKRPVGIMQDLCGPKMRLSGVASPDMHVQPGDTLRITTDRHVQQYASTPGFAFDASTTYAHLVDDVRHGDTILLNDGRLEFQVHEKCATHVTVRVVRGGPVQIGKGLNLPGVALSTDAVTAKDWRDLEWGLVHGVDYVALSFVRHPQDVLQVQQRIANAGSQAMLIAKIERPEALEYMQQIVAAADGLMVARGDLGLETELTRVPLVQKHLIQLCRQAAKPVITATQMLDSMVNDSTPTRAEVSDVANAILDGSDAIMLSNETATGKFPNEAVRVLHRIAVSTETEWSRRAAAGLHGLGRVSTACALSEAAAVTALDLKARRVVVYSQSGHTARLIARLRLPMPVVALTNVPATYNQLSLSYGVTPVLMPQIVDLRQMLAEMDRLVLEQGWGEAGDTLVVVSALDGRDGDIDTLHVHQVARA